MPDATDFAEGIYQDVTAVILAQWPEVAANVRRSGNGANGVWQAEHLDQVPYGDLVPPYAVIHISDLSSTDQGASDADAWMATVDVYYVCQVTGPLSAIRKKLMGMRQALNVAVTDWIEIYRAKNLSWDDSLLPNQFFAAAKKTHRAGRIRFTGIVTDSFYGTDEE